MPIKSKAQRRKFAELLLQGKVSKKTFEEWNRAAGDAELPERLHPKVVKKVTKAKKKTKAKRSPRTKTARTKRKRRPTAR